jgi:hypothetical protein
MQFAAIVEQRPKHAYVHIPALSTGGPVPDPNDVQACADELAAAATGLPAADVQVSLSHAVPGNALLPVSPTEVEVRHKGIWRAARHTGWLREWTGLWWPLVEYTADSATWKRAVHVSSFRQPGLPVHAVPEPRGRDRTDRSTPWAAVPSA